MIKPAKRPPGELPSKLTRTLVDGDETETFSVELQTITPILGGSYRTRQVDEVDFIRGATIRGHLRFWWRAICGHEYQDAVDLAAAERRLWGGLGANEAQRSAVEIRVDVTAPRRELKDDTDLGFNAPGFYALWPAKSDTHGNPPAPRWKPGIRFKVRVRCPKNSKSQVRDAVQAWILFGGYGSRTRRGLGSVTVTGDGDKWLPSAATKDAISTLFKGRVWLSSEPRADRDTPSLKGASLRAGQPTRTAEEAWIHGLDWLKTFRQGRDFARDRGQGNTPGRSKWPEPDKVRRLSKEAPWTHAPRHNDTMVWPRAGFGLPIVGRFKSDEIANKQLQVFELNAMLEGGSDITRLASPLILKAMPLANGQFVPIALWLNRAYPTRAKVCLKNGNARRDRSTADFDELVAPGDQVFFKPLEKGQSKPRGQRLRTAFMQWLSTLDTKEVLP